MKNRNIKDKVVASTSYGIIEQALNIVLGFLISILLVRFLKREDYGIINYVASYAVIINFINIAPENYLYKIYYKKSKNDIQNYIKSFFIFNFIKGLFVIVINSLIGIYLWKTFNNYNYLLVILTNGITFLMSQFISIIRIMLELEFKQKLITKAFFISRLINLIILLLLILISSVKIVLIANLLYFSLQLILMINLVKEKLEFFKTQFSIHSLNNYLKDSLIQYSIWTHLSGFITSFIYKIDPFILGFFVSMKDIGTYSISLNASNYFIILFQVLQKNALIALGNIDQEKKQKEIVRKFIVISTTLSIVQYLLFIFFGKYLISFYTKTDLDIVYYYSIYIILGLTIVNSVRPLISYLTIKDNLRKFFSYCILPTGIFTTIIYFVSAYKYGTIGIAKANVAAYLFWSILLFIRAKKIGFK